MLTVYRLMIILAISAFVPWSYSYLLNNDPCTTAHCVWMLGFGYVAFAAALGLIALYHLVIVLEWLWMSGCPFCTASTNRLLAVIRSYCRVLSDPSFMYRSIDQR